MEHFVVSARKYRPITFDSVVGQSHITTTLKNAIRTNHLAQAFLFCGPRGVGKTTCARILAKTINCQNLSDDVEPCGACDSCVSFQNNASFNIHELDAASNNSVDDIRNLIDQVRYPPQTGKYKIYIIDEVHMLSPAAFNAFLKTLEEPPGYAIFILATTEKHKILPTILSRCQIFDFNRIQSRAIADHLADIAVKEGITAEREALELIGQKADGGLRDALSMFDLNVTFSPNDTLTYTDVVENLHILDYDYYFKITDALLRGSISDSLLLFDEIVRKGFDGHLFVIGLLEHFRNLLVSKDPVTISLLEVSDMAQSRYLDQSYRADMSFLLSAMSVGSQCDLHYKTSKNQRLHVELCLMKMAKLPEILSLQDLPESENGTEHVKKKVDPGVSLSTEATPVYEKQAEKVLVVEVAAPVPATKPAGMVIPAGSRLRTTAHIATPSLHQGLPSDKTPERASPQYEDEVLPIGGKLDLSYENVLLVWNEFAERRKVDRNSTTEEITLNREFSLSNQTIHIALDNILQQETLLSLKSDLMGHLKKRIQAPQLALEPRVAPQDVKRMPYTAAEKFSFMAEKNPHLMELQKALGLDTDF